MDDIGGIPPNNCQKVFIQRDFSEGTSVKFLTKFPAELNGKLEPEIFVRTVTQLNTLYGQAETLGGRNYFESCLACLTAYTIYLCFNTRYETYLKEINKFIAEQNQDYYVPRGLMLVDPVERGLRTLEICILNESGSR